MKKKLDISTVANSLRGESVFFPTKEGKPATEEAGNPKENQRPEDEIINSHIEPIKQTAYDTMTPRYHDTVIPSNPDTRLPLSEEDMIEAVRKAVRKIGKEPAT